MGTCILGIDGGGTKTICVAADAGGRIIGKGMSGPANYLKEGLYTSKMSLSEAIDRALQEAGSDRLSVEVVCAGIAGMGRAADRLIMKKSFAEIVPNARLVLETDAFITLVGATEYLPGVIVISGTGSIAMGLNEKGDVARAGGWGHILGDEGSGYDIARRGMIAALQDYDGRGPETLITKMIVEELYLANVEELIGLFYGAESSPRRIAGLYPLVLEAAEEGDAVASNLLEKAASALVKTAVAVIRRLEMQSSIFPIALSGGVFRNSPRLRNSFQRLLVTQVPGAHLIDPLHPPEIGALLVAHKAVNNF